MSRLIQDFSIWKKVNEDNTPGREKERGSSNNKVVAIPIDATSLKLKVVNDADVINAEGKLTIDGFDSILKWIKGQGEIINYYKALNDLDNNVVVYSIGKDNDRKQVIFFKIYSKASLKTDPSKPGINTQVRFVRQDELDKALNGTILNTKEIATISSGSASAGNLRLPFPVASIKDSTSPDLLKFIISAYNKLRKEPEVASSPLMPKVKAEAQAKKLGAATLLFVKAMNHGFAIKDDEFPEDVETDITQSLFDKIAAITETESTIIRGFDIDAFLAVAREQVAGDTGNIKVPANGFVEGVQKNDPELKKFQELLATKFSKALANHSTFQKFKKAGARGYIGNYGPLTRDLVRLLKVGLTDPKWDKGDNGSVIEPEFVSRIIAEKTNEARTYLSIDGFTLITEGFDQGAMATVDKEISSSSASASARVDRESNVKKVEPKSSKEYSGSEIGTNFTYKVEGGFWKYKNGNAWTKVMNPSSIKKLMEKFPKSVSGGNYAIVPTKDFDETWAKSKAAFIYQKSGGKWQYSTPGPAGWTDIADPKSKQYLDKYYGSGSSSSSSTSGSQAKTLDKIDSFEAIGAIQTKLEQAVSAAGITLSEGGIKADATGLKWEFNGYKYQLSTNGQITGKDNNDKQFISGKISADYSKVVLSSGVTVSIKEFLRRTTMNDLKKKNLSDTRIVELAGKLESSLMRTNTSEETINGVYKAIKTYADLVAIHKQFDKITQTGKNLLGALNGDLSTAEFTELMSILDDNGLLGTTIYTDDGASGYGKMLAIAKAAIDNK